MAPQTKQIDNQRTLALMNKNYSTVFSNHLLYKINLKHITHPSNIYSQQPVSRVLFIHEAIRDSLKNLMYPK